MFPTPVPSPGAMASAAVDLVAEGTNLTVSAAFNFTATAAFNFTGGDAAANLTGNDTADPQHNQDYDFYQVPPLLVVVLSVLYGSISVIAVAGNGLVIWAIVTSRRMRSVTNHYLANLAFADILIALFAIPFEVSNCLLIIVRSLIIYKRTLITLSRRDA